MGNDLDSLLDELDSDDLNADYTYLWSKKMMATAKKGNDTITGLVLAMNVDPRIKAVCAFARLFKGHIIICSDNKIARIIAEQECPFPVYTMAELSYVAKMCSQDSEFAKEVHSIKQAFPCHIDAITMSPDQVTHTAEQTNELH